MARIKLVTNHNAPKRVKKAFRYTDHDPLEKALDLRQEMLSTLDGSIDDIEGIKFSRKEIDILDEFIEYYNGDNGDTDSMNRTASRIIELAKTIDENGDDVKMIPDAKYDRILNIFLRYGNEESLPRAIATGSITTISTGYEKLANNLDKSYTVYEADEIPFGVSEGNQSVEDFLIKAYKASGYKFDREIEIEISPKLDGVSINGTVINGKFRNMSTRGKDGEGLHVKALDGFEISGKAAIIDAEEFGAQFEAFVTYDALESIAELEGVEYASNRSAASGIINRATNPKKDSSGLIPYLHFYPIEVDGVDFDTHEEKVAFLNDMATCDGLIERVVIKGSLKKLLKNIKKVFEEYARIRESRNYSIDGIVCTILDDKMVSTLGRKGRKNKYQIALKFDPSREVGQIASVDLSAGKKGYRTLMARLNKPVQIDGVDYRNVQIKTLEEFEKLDLHVGDNVVITRGGDVIPKIDKVEESGEGEKIKLPTRCPYCNEKLSEKGKKLFCANDSCLGNRAGNLIGFFEALDVKGVGFATAKDLSVMSSTVSKLVHNLENNPHLITDVAGGKKIYKDTMSALKNLDAVTALVAVGADGIGPGKALKILEKITLDEIINVETDEDVENIIAKLKTAPGFGKSTDELIHNLLREIDSIVALSAFVTHTGSVNKDAVRIGHTGFSKGSDEMDILKELIENREEYRIVEGKAFDILVTKSYDSDSGKMESAEKKGLSKNDGIYTLKDFKSFIEK